MDISLRHAKYLISERPITMIAGINYRCMITALPSYLAFDAALYLAALPLVAGSLGQILGGTWRCDRCDRASRRQRGVAGRCGGVSGRGNLHDLLGERPRQVGQGAPDLPGPSTGHRAIRARKFHSAVDGGTNPV